MRIFSPPLFLLMLFAFSRSEQRRWWLPMIHWSQKLSHICRTRVVAGQNMVWSWSRYGRATLAAILQNTVWISHLRWSGPCIPLLTIDPLGGEPSSFILYPQSTDHPNSWVAQTPFALKPGTTHKIWITRSTAQPFVKRKWGKIFLFYSNFLYLFSSCFWNS